MTITLHYVAHQPLARPVFGVLITREDGVIIGETKNKYDGNWPESIEGAGVVRCKVELPLLPGQYNLAATIYDEHLVHPYDHCERYCSFWVRAGKLSEHFGTLKLAARWESDSENGPARSGR